MVTNGGDGHKGQDGGNGEAGADSGDKVSTEMYQSIVHFMYNFHFLNTSSKLINVNSS